jgi:hypothetical protein
MEDALLRTPSDPTLFLERLSGELQSYAIGTSLQHDDVCVVCIQRTRDAAGPGSEVPSDRAIAHD